MNTNLLVGKLQGAVDKSTRYIEVARPESEIDKNNLLIPLRYWTLDEHNALMSLKEGTLVAINGRLDHDEKIGLFVLVEQLNVIK